MAYMPVATGNIIQPNTINLLANGAAWFSEDTGSGTTPNAYKVTYSGATPNFNTIASLNNGQIFTFVAATSNNNAGSGASTLQVNALSAIAITKNGGAPLAVGDITAGQMVTVVYNADNSRFELMAAGSAGSANSYYGATSGTNTYTVTVSPAPAAYVAGMVVYAKVGVTNTSGTCTLAVNALGAKSIKKYATINPDLGDMIAGEIALLVYDGTNFQLLNPSAKLPLAYGGTGADLSASGGANQVLKQSTAGGAITASVLGVDDVPSLDASKLKSGTVYQALIPASAADMMNKDQNSGLLASITTAVATGTLDQYVAADPTGKYVYASNSTSGTVSQFKINPDGSLTSLGTAFTVGTTPAGLAVDPSGRFLYVANSGSNTISQLKIGTDGSLSSIATAIASGTTPVSVAVDPFGRFVWVANNGAASLSYYRINSDGSLTSGGTAITGDTGVIALCVEPLGRWLWAIATGSSIVRPYTINQSTGAPAAGTSLAVGSAPSGICTDPQGRFVYVSNSTGNTVSQLKVGASGALTSITTDIAVGTTPRKLCCDPTGRWIYVPNSGAGTLSVLAIKSDGSLLSVGTVTVGTTPYSVASDPLGRYLYVANSGANTISMFACLQSNSTVNDHPNASRRNLPLVALAASSNSVIDSNLASSWGTVRIIDNQGNVVDYTLVNGTLTQISTNTTYSVTTTPAASKVGLGYASGSLTIYTGTTWSGYKWAAFMDVTQ